MSKQKKSQTGQYNKPVVIKQSQGPLVPSQGLGIILWAVSCELSDRCWNPHQVGEVNSLMTRPRPWQKPPPFWEPASRNGNKPTPELKTNCTWNDQDDTRQTTDDRSQDACQSWRCCFCLQPPPSDCESSCPNGGRDRKGERGLPPPEVPARHLKHSKLSVPPTRPLYGLLSSQTPLLVTKWSLQWQSAPPPTPSVEKREAERLYKVEKKSRRAQLV